MTTEQCFAAICFFPLDADSPKFFGFGEFLSALALLVLVWTTTDSRYRFRVATAVVPLRHLTFAAVAGVGTLTLLTDLWRAEEWLVPAGNIITPALWQAILGGLFLSTFLAWAWFAFLQPPIFRSRNARHFSVLLFQKITEGSTSEMGILAQELQRSIPALVKAGPSYPRYGRENVKTEPTELEGIVHEILLLIADPRFCRAMVVSAPGTIHSLFYQITHQKKYNLPVDQVARNIVTAAIEYKDSFLYHETEGHKSGLLGYWKPISQAMFSDYDLVRSVKSLFDCEYKTRDRWTADEWGAYTRAVLIAVGSSVNANLWDQPYAINRALNAIENMASDLHKIDGMENGGWADDSVQRLRVSVDFCKNAMKMLGEKEVPADIKRRIREDDPYHVRTIYDQISDVMFEIIFDAANIRRPSDLCWSIQHNMVWSEFMNDFSEECDGIRLVRFKLRRKIYDEIVSAEDWPNFKNIKYLSFCINVMGFEIHKGEYNRDERALHKAILSWTKRNYASLERKSPNVFQECLTSDISYDQEKCRLVKTQQATAFNPVPEYIFFDLDKPEDSIATI